MRVKILGFIFTLLICSYGLHAQKGGKKANFFAKSKYIKEIPALSKMDNIISAKGREHVAPPKRQGANRIVPGKGFPKKGDPLAKKQMKAFRQTARRRTRSMTTTANFDAHQGTVLNDPTGAIGPNHYVYAFNSGFGILDRAGNVLLPEASLATLFPGEDDGDPIVMYDRYADRFIIMQFFGVGKPVNGLLIAVCKGSDPVNDGWYTYRFDTDAFPDYEKMSIWSDGYYITANKNQSSATTSQVVYALERDKMLLGEEAQMIGFPLPGISNSGFYSPGGFNANGATLPPAGVGHQIVYMQDDGWAGVDRDHLKIWTTTVDWVTPANSSISTPQELDVTAFDGVLDNGSFQNLDEPGDGPDIDALQATMMFMTNYRRFGTHNSVVMNHVVDVDGDEARAGIRWYELRQATDGAPWKVHQEGTYVNPDGHSAFSGSIGMDKQGNIGLGYTIVSSTVFTSIRYTGRLATDPLGVMTLGEHKVVDGDSKSNRADGRYGDYAQITMDPTDDLTFWHIGEYMKGDASTVRRSRVVAFKIGSESDDTEAPSIPGPLVATNLLYNGLTLNWGRSTDNVGVISYEVFLADTLFAFAGDTSLVVKGLSSLTTYNFKVRAKDGNGNLSEFSDVLTITTPNSPFCLNGITNYPYSEGFENNFGGWTPMDNKSIKWKIASGPTPAFYTGPDSAAQGTFYAYATRKFCFGNANKEAFLLSPCFNLGSLVNPTFSFQYHLQSFYEPGSVSLDISKDNGRTWETLWIQTGNQGSEWNSVQVNLTKYIGENVQLRFNRVSNFGSTADIAIDDVRLGEPVTCLAGQVKLDIAFDNFPEELSWELRNEAGVVIDSAQYTAAGTPDGSDTTVVFNIPNGKYTFVMLDSFGDGLVGRGSYTLSIGNRVIATNTNFGREEATGFCLDNSIVPCKSGETTFPYTEGFENTLGAWTQTNSKGLRWVSIKPRDYFNPNTATEGDYYAYVHPWRGNPFFPSVLTSPCFDLSKANNPVFTFKYYMNAPFKTGTLTLEISVDNGASWTGIWGRSGNQGREWIAESLSLKEYAGQSVQLRFVGHTNAFLWSNIAVDDLVLNTEGECNTGEVTLSLTFDNYPEETSWELTDIEGNIIDSASYTAATTPDGSTITRTFSGLVSGNYKFTIRDRVGDGICCRFGEGSYTLTSTSGLIVASNGQFRREESTTFCLINKGTSSQASRRAIRTYALSDNEGGDFNVYPNPATNTLNIKANGKEVQSAVIYSLFGRQVKSIQKAGTTSIDISDLPAGSYYIGIINKNGKRTTLKFIKL